VQAQWLNVRIAAPPGRKRLFLNASSSPMPLQLTVQLLATYLVVHLMYHQRNHLQTNEAMRLRRLTIVIAVVVAAPVVMMWSVVILYLQLPVTIIASIVLSS
jgi:uncharacterized membrane-anchored protein